MRAAARDLQDAFDSILCARVDRVLGAGHARQCQLVLGDVEPDRLQPHGLGVLDRDVSEAADARDHDPLPRPGVGFFQSLIGGDAGAQDRRNRGEIHVRRQARSKRGRSDHIFGKPAIHAIAGVVLMLAQRFPTRLAIFTAHAGIMQPGDADRIPKPIIGDTRTQCGHHACGLVTGNEGRRRLHRPVAGCSVQIGVTNAASFDLGENFAGTRHGHRDVFDYQRLAQRPHHRRLHQRLHRSALLFPGGRLSSKTPLDLDRHQTRCGLDRPRDM
jgi:hypothetical protein